jgi:hypothetical protein
MNNLCSTNCDFCFCSGFDFCRYDCCSHNCYNWDFDAYDVVDFPRAYYLSLEVIPMENEEKMNEYGEEIGIEIVSVADTDHVFLSVEYGHIALGICGSMENDGKNDYLTVRAGHVFCDQSLRGRAVVNVRMPA